MVVTKLEAAAKVIGINRARSVDIIARDVTVGGSNVFYSLGTAAARTDLTLTDKVSFPFLTEGVGRSRAWNMPSDEEDYYVAVIHPMLLPDLEALSTWQNVSFYQKEGEELYDGEVGRLAGVRFCLSYNAKVFLSGGATAQAATTLNGAVAAGDTSVIVTSATGLSTGDYITIGTLEAATAEQVQITATSGTTLTVKGIGSTQSNFGLRYAHANAAAVTEAACVYPITLLGPKSMAKAYSTITGPKGDIRITGPFDVLGRFQNVGWFLIAGWKLTSNKWTLRLEQAGSYKHIGANQF